MSPMAKPTPNPGHALGQLNDALTKLRNTLDSTVSNRVESAAQQPSQVSNHRKRHASDLTNILLAQTVAVKVAHDTLLDNVAVRRNKFRDKQAELLRARQRLDNLSYERDVLLRRIASCRKTQSPLLHRAAVPRAPALFDATEADEATARAAFDDTLAAIERDAAARRAARDELDVAVADTAAKRRRLMSKRADLAGLSRAVADVAAVVAPVRALIGPAADAADDHVTSGLAERAAALPKPLYVLARLAIGYCSAGGAGLRVDIVDENGNATAANGAGSGGGGADGEEEGIVESDLEEGEKVEPKQEADEVYKPNAAQVRFDISADAVGPQLRLWFRLLPLLGIVVVRCCIVADGAESADYPTRELRALFPGDNGDRSPCAGNGYLCGGQFRFDAAKAGGRPFVWANILCGIECLPDLGDEGDASDEWIAEMRALVRETRFNTVMATLRQRVAAIVALKQQIDSLLLRKISVSAEQLGQGWPTPAAQLEAFERRSDDGEFWSANVVGRAGLRLTATLRVASDYPRRRPDVRLHRTPDPASGADFGTGEDGGERVSVDDAQLAAIERAMVSAEVEGHEELALGAQVTVLLRMVDETEALCLQSN